MNISCDLCEAQKEDYRLVYETNLSFCVICRDAIKENHLLILPKRHVTGLEDLTEKEAKDLMDTVSLFKKLFLEHYDEDPTLHMNFGAHSTQPHIHFHLVSTKGHFRALVSANEDIPTHPKRAKDEETMLRDKIKELLST